MTSAMRSWRQSYAFVFLGTLGIVAAADFFMYGHRLGWTIAAVAAAMLAVLCIRDSRFLQTTGGKLAAAAMVGLLVALIEQPTWLNVTYALICLSVLALINSGGWTSDFTRWLQRWFRWLGTGWARLFLDNSIAMRWLIRRGFSPRMAKGIAGWVIPVLLSSIFVGIFAWANPVISNWFSQLGTWLNKLLENLPELLNFGRMMYWLAFAVLAWSLLRSRSWRSRAAATTPDELIDASALREHNALGFPVEMVVRCLILFNVVFAVENVLDLWYLYGGHFGVDGTAYKQYVRRGAYPLVAAALLAGAFVLVTFRPRSETERSPAARKLVYFWIGQTILLTLSSVWRLVRYVELTELTRLRVASTVWFILVGAGLCYIIWRIVRGRSNRWLININALTAMVMLYPCCFINFDGIIANFNANHCEEANGGGSPLDIDYFYTLGTPALPALDQVRDKIEIRPRRESADEVSRLLHAELAENLSDWRSWTWRRQRAAQEVQAVQLAKSRDAQQLADARNQPNAH
jgi:hypothetical protein